MLKLVKASFSNSVFTAFSSSKGVFIGVYLNSEGGLRGILCTRARRAPTDDIRPNPIMCNKMLRGAPRVAHS